MNAKGRLTKNRVANIVTFKSYLGKEIELGMTGALSSLPRYGNTNAKFLRKEAFFQEKTLKLAHSN